jgi:hypothetical protein
MPHQSGAVNPPSSALIAQDIGRKIKILKSVAIASSTPELGVDPLVTGCELLNDSMIRSIFAVMAASVTQQGPPAAAYPEAVLVQTSEHFQRRMPPTTQQSTPHR